MSENFLIMSKVLNRMREIRRAFIAQSIEFPESEEQIWHPSDIVKLLDYFNNGISYYEVDQLLEQIEDDEIGCE